jgi:hypothetical protein
MTRKSKNRAPMWEIAGDEKLFNAYTKKYWPKPVEFKRTKEWEEERAKAKEVINQLYND